MDNGGHNLCKTVSYLQVSSFCTSPTEGENQILENNAQEILYPSPKCGKSCLSFYQWAVTLALVVVGL